MDKGTFDTVTRISEEMKSLKAINERINKATLSFIRDDYYDAIYLSKWKKVIQDILSRHEAGIRREIDDRYNNLKKQIEEL